MCCLFCFLPQGLGLVDAINRFEQTGIVLQTIQEELGVSREVLLTERNRLTKTTFGFFVLAFGCVQTPELLLACYVSNMLLAK